MLEHESNAALQSAALSMFKLVPAAQDFSICLRCQYRLSLRQGPRSGRRHPTGYPHRLRRFTSGPNLRQEQISTHDAAPDDGNLERVPIRYYTEELYPNQNYRHGNEPSTKDSLGLNVLGEPAKVLILRDKQNRIRVGSNMARVRVSSPDNNPAQEPISSFGMLEEMDAERGIVDIDNVCNNIESVRASWAARTKGNITGVAYKDLASRLQEGFTRQQLGAYLDRARRNPAAGIFDLNVETSNNLYARSSWQPVGHTSLQKSKAPRIAYNTPEADLNEKDVPGPERRQGLSKGDLVERILRQCWEITPKFQDSQLGELDLRLQKLHLNLILNHKRDILKQISRSYDSKVEAWPQDRIIRITSDYDNCIEIFKLLLHTLENIKVSTIDLDVDFMSHEGLTPFPRELNDVMLRRIEGYTNTLVRPQGVSRKTLRVFYLGPDDDDLLETRRLVHQILRPASTQNQELAWSTGDRPSNAIPAPVVVGSRLSLLDRNQQWSRWCSPCKKGRAGRRRKADGAPPSSSSAGPMAQELHGELGFDTVKSFFGAPDDSSYKLCNNVSPYWKSDIEYHDAVKLGQVLFPANRARTIADELERNRRRTKMSHRIRPIHPKDIGLKASRIPREFLPLVPGLVRTLEDLGTLEKSEEFLRIRLSPWSKNVSLPVPVEALPDLEIMINFNRKNKTTSIKDVILVNVMQKDFLQPRNVVDLRFVRKHCVFAKEDSIDPHITAFVQNSDFDILGSERLKTPLGLSLSIPALAIQPHNGFDPTSYETLLVDYISLSLEYTSSLTMSYQDPNSWPTLTYTNVEAGPIGGRRDELSLHSSRFTSKKISPTDNPNRSALSNIPTESLSDDHHTSILFHKTVSLIESIEQVGKEKDNKPGLIMPKLKRWRRIKRRTVRMVKSPGASDRPGYVPPVNETVRRVVADQSARLVGKAL